MKWLGVLLLLAVQRATADPERMVLLTRIGKSSDPLRSLLYAAIKAHAGELNLLGVFVDGDCDVARTMLASVEMGSVPVVAQGGHTNTLASMIHDGDVIIQNEGDMKFLSAFLNSHQSTFDEKVKRVVAVGGVKTTGDGKEWQLASHCYNFVEDSTKAAVHVMNHCLKHGIQLYIHGPSAERDEEESKLQFSKLQTQITAGVTTHPALCLLLEKDAVNQAFEMEKNRRRDPGKRQVLAWWATYTDASEPLPDIPCGEYGQAVARVSKGTLPLLHLAAMESNFREEAALWGTKFEKHMVFNNIPADIGTVIDTIYGLTGTETCTTSRFSNVVFSGSEVKLASPTGVDLVWCSKNDKAFGTMSYKKGALAFEHQVCSKNTEGEGMLQLKSDCNSGCITIQSSDGTDKHVFVKGSKE